MLSYIFSPTRRMQRKLKKYSRRFWKAFKKGYRNSCERNFVPFFEMYQLLDTMELCFGEDGDFRSATNKKYRGNGLSSVKNYIGDNLFDSFEVISGRGRCILKNNGVLYDDNLKNYLCGLYGTIYTFTLR